VQNADAEGYYRCQNCNSRVGAGGIRIIGERSQSGSSGGVVTTERIDGLSIKCPRCGATYVYFDAQRNNDGQFRCQNCAAPLSVVGEKIVVESVVTHGERGPGSGALVCIGMIMILFVPWIIVVPLGVAVIWLGLRHSTESRVVKKKDDTGASID